MDVFQWSDLLGFSSGPGRARGAGSHVAGGAPEAPRQCEGEPGGSVKEPSGARILCFSFSFSFF